MKTFFASLLALSTGIAGAAEFKIGAHTFTLPEGFTIDLAASSPLVDRPIEADFDDKGRLYVTDSSGSNDKAEKQLADKPHRVVRLEDTNGDGKYDKSVVFADKMMFPEGAMWHEGSLYVSAPPSIWKLTDTDGDGVADKREEWFKGGTLTGCANDLHGPYSGPDGWIYWNKGAFAKQTHERPGEAPIVTRASHTFRMRPDGSHLEVVMTGGMDNPVGLAFTPEGERFFTATFLQHPEAGKRDGLVHEIYGGVYGKRNDVNDDHPQTGELMPITTHLGAAAPCGLLRYKSGAMGMKNDMFVCNFNMHKVTRHILHRQGATYKTQDSDFVFAADTDFHPTDVLEDADGSILIVDTGGWYKLCCPTSQLAKPDVLGAIYRVRKNGMKKPELKEDKLSALWATIRKDSPEARAAVRKALNDSDESTRIAAAHGVSAWRDAQAKSALLQLLEKGTAPEKRVAAEALGRLKDESVIPAILRASAKDLDRALEHSLAFALIEIGKPDAVRVGLKAEHVNTRKVALIALSQIPDALKAEDVASLLTSGGEMQKTAEWIAAKHPEWGATFADSLRARIQRKEFNATEAETLTGIIAQLTPSKEIQDLVADLCKMPKREASLTGLRAIARAGLKKAPDSWTDAVRHAITSSDSEVKKEAIATARALNLGKEAASLSAALTQAAATEANSTPVRVAALRARPEGMTLDETAFDLLVKNIHAGAAVEVRGDAVGALLRANLNDEQRLQLADAMAHAGPMELSRLFEAFEKKPSEALGARLIEALKKSTVVASLPPDFVLQKLAKFPDAVKKAAESLPRASQGDVLAQRARLEEMLSELKGGDVRRGQAIFNDARVACVSCHSMGYLGGKVGPDLTSIGQVRNEMDLLEAILFPSASFVRSFEPVVVKTKDGEPHTGILRGDNEQGVLLVTGANMEERIARGEIADMQPGTVSIMPAGLDTQLKKQELADLLAFLKATKWGAN
ncbi:MAG TPA: PVC-type heme-binding CxxCH protein [Verrucomicrobiae bacterium]|nr:PVC-type heme-binding CxxCH protein [Verrucomicrobiae bacterium]